MAKRSMVARENKRIKMCDKYAKKRDELRNTIKTSDDYAIIDEAVNKLQKLPVNSSACRQVNRCNQCGRPHGVYKKFRLCRICLRNQLMLGNVPGGKKASW